MTRPPLSAILLGAAGLLPFLWSVAVLRGWIGADMGDPADGGYPLIVAGDGAAWLLSYGTIILSFMSGVLWGFATRAERGDMWWAFGLSVLPALWAFFNAGDTAAQLTHVAWGFLGLLLLDGHYQRRGLAPGWWMTLRLPLTAVVVACLLIGANA